MLEGAFCTGYVPGLTVKVNFGRLKGTREIVEAGSDVRWRCESVTERRGECEQRRKRVGYVIPEFPGQTHIWIWREIEQLREMGLPLTLFSTRRPPASERARHAFAAGAEAETVFLWPRGVVELIGVALWAMVTRPVGVLRCVQLAMRLPVDGGMMSVLKLIPPAMVLAREAKKRRVDHLHCHTAANGLVLAMLAKRLTGVSISFTLNANIDWWGGAMREKIEDCAFVAAVSGWLLEQVRERSSGLTADRAFVCHNGVDLRVWTARDAAARSGGVRVITVGRLHEGKGHDVLIRAFARVVQEGVEGTLEVIGEGPARESLERLVDELGMSGKVTLPGSMAETQVRERLLASDVFALASHSEGLGVVYMEAMATGMAAVGTAVGGTLEIITDGVDGLLVPPGDVEAMADALKRVMTDRSLRERLAMAGRRRIESKFDARIGARQMLERFAERSDEVAT